MYIKLGETESFRKFQDNINFQKGAEIFRKMHNLPVKYPEARKLIDNDKKPTPDSIKYRWYKKIIQSKDWKDYKDFGYPILDTIYDIKTLGSRQRKVIKEVIIAYMSVLPTDDLPITDKNELQKIYNFLSVKNVKV